MANQPWCDDCEGYANHATDDHPAWERAEMRKAIQPSSVTPVVSPVITSSVTSEPVGSVTDGGKSRQELWKQRMGDGWKAHRRDYMRAYRNRQKGGA